MSNEMETNDDIIRFTKMPSNYLGRYGDVVLEDFPAMRQLFQQLQNMPTEHRQFFVDYLIKFGMLLSQPGKFAALEAVMLRLLQLPAEEREAWGHGIMAMMAMAKVADEERSQG